MTDELFGDQEDPEFDAYVEHRQALMGQMFKFAEERDIDEGLLAALLLDTAVSISSLDYILSVAKPSESGLKMNFDRFQRAFVDLIRMAKKEAKDILVRTMAALEEGEATGPKEDER